MAKHVWIDRFEPLEVWSFPLRTENVLIILLFGLVFSFIVGSIKAMGAAAFVRSIMTIYVSLLLFAGYLFVILDFTTQGYQSIPKLSGGLLDAAKPRFFSVMVITSLFFSIAVTLKAPFAQLAWALTSLLLLPVSISVLVIEESLGSALNPLKWAVVIRALTPDRRLLVYLILLVASLFSGYIALVLRLGWLNVPTMLLLVATLMTLFRSLGVVLHNHADELGLKTRFGKHVEAAQIKAANDQALSEFSLELYKLSNGGRTKRAWELLEQRLISDRYETEGELYEQLRCWENPQLAVKAGQGYIERLVLRGDDLKAWEILEFCYTNNDAQFVLLSGSSTLKLAQHTSSIRQRVIMADILSYFDEDFPKHPESARAQLLCARFTADDMNDPAKARKILKRLRIKSPEVRYDPEFEALQNLISAV